MMKKKRCGECGSRQIEEQNAKGKAFPYKSFARVKLNGDVTLNTCANCGNILLESGDSDRLDKALERSLTGSLQHYISNISHRTSWKQNEMADFIGMTPVYISEMKTGKKIPEFKTFNYIKLLSELPGAIEMVVEDDPRCALKKTYTVIMPHSLHPKTGSFKVSSETVEPIDSNDFGMAA